MRTSTALLFSLLGFVTAAFGQTGPAGKVNFSRLASSSLDPYTSAPTVTQQQWFQTHFTRMVVYSPYFDSRTSWYPNAQVYQDLYAIYTNSAVVSQHPEWILHDQSGNRLYIPWGCANGTCPQYAADIANPNFRAWWIAQVAAIFTQGNYKGLWIDDVNMNFSISDVNGNFVAPVDDSTGTAMTWGAWRYYVAQFAMQIRQAFPNKEIVHNSVWFAGPTGIRDADPAIQLQISAADIIDVERGIGSDPGLTGGVGIWSLVALFAFIDRVHQTGHTNVLLQYDVTDEPTREYSLAGYFLTASGHDYYGDTATTPDNWWNGFDVNLGAPLGPRTYSNGIFQRNFANGLVLLADPLASTQTINLPGSFQTVDGAVVSSVTLAAKQGAILIGPFPNATLPALSLDTTSLPAGTSGAFYNQGLQASGGSGLYSFAASGAPGGMAINGWNLSGTPSGAGNSNVLLTVTDTSTNATAQKSLPLTVMPALGIHNSSLPSGTVGTPYSTTLGGAGGSSNYIWSIVNQPRPLAISGSSLAGTPSAAGTSSGVIVSMMDSGTGISVTNTYSIVIAPGAALAITTTSLPSGVVGTNYSASLAASGGSGSYSWSATGLPQGISLSGNTLTGRPTRSGTWSNVVVTVTDKVSKAKATATYTITITNR
jgi:hypothetical protein